MLLALATTAIATQPTSVPQAANAGTPAIPTGYATADPRLPQRVHLGADGLRNTIEGHLGHSAAILIARVEGFDRAIRLRPGPEGIVTPLRLTVERVLADEIDNPPGFRYVRVGGTLDGWDVTIDGFGPDLQAGQRYVFFLNPYTLEDGTLDPANMNVRYAMPVTPDGRIPASPGDGIREATTLPEIVARVGREAPSERWRPVPGERLKLYDTP